jgi:hypothetical protein
MCLSTPTYCYVRRCENCTACETSRRHGINASLSGQSSEADLEKLSMNISLLKNSLLKNNFKSYQTSKAWHSATRRITTIGTKKDVRHTSISSYAPKLSVSTEKVKPKSMPSNLFSRSCSSQTQSLRLSDKINKCVHETALSKSKFDNFTLSV